MLRFYGEGLALGARGLQVVSALKPTSPYGAGLSSGNHKIGQAAGTNRVVYRFVAKKTGTLFDAWVETRARTGPACSPTLADTDAAESSSYSGGNPNNWLWEVRFHPVDPATGLFDAATNLVPARQFNPYFQRRQTSTQQAGTATLSALKIPVGETGMSVVAETAYAMTIAPVNADPATDYASVNHLYTDDGLEGAQSRNELNRNVRDAYYGIDPRTVMGGANAAGSSQWYPGNNFNTAPFTKHLPTLVLVYSDGTRQPANPYFSAASGSAPTLAGTEYTTTFKPPVAGTFTHLRAIFGAADTFNAILAKNGSDVGTVTFTSAATNPGRVVTKRLPTPVPYTSSDTLTVRFTTSVENAVIRIYMNGAFDSLLGTGASYFASLTGDVKRVMPVFPVPWPQPVLLSGSAPAGAPSTPTAFTATGGSGSVALAWTPPGESYLFSYNVYRDGALLANVAAPASGYSDTTGTYAQSYSYRVSAVGLDGRESALAGAQSAASSAPASIGTPTIRGANTATTASATHGIPVTSAVALGSSLFIIVAGRNSSAVLSSVADTQGNTYTISAQKQDVSPNQTIAIARGQIATALTTSDTVTATFTGATFGPSRMGHLVEVTGIKTSSATDQTLTAAAGSTLTAQTIGPTGATVQAVELVLAAWVGTAAASSVTGTNGYTATTTLQKTSGAASGDRELGAVYKILAATGAQTATATFDVGVSAAAVIATFKGA